MKISTPFAVLLVCGCTQAVQVGTTEGDEKPLYRTETTATAARALFEERCKTAGVTISQTAENVEGIYLVKLRPKGINYSDQFKLDDPYGRDLGGDSYIQSFLRDSYQRLRKPVPEGLPRRVGFQYVEAEDPVSGVRIRYTGAWKVIGTMERDSPNVRAQLAMNPNMDLNVYGYRMERAFAGKERTRYGVTFEDISTREDRRHWIAGSSLKVIDLSTKEVMAERIGYMRDPGLGDRSAGRSPWFVAADFACPSFSSRFPNAVVRLRGVHSQVWQTPDFVEMVLKPMK